MPSAKRSVSKGLRKLFCFSVGVIAPYSESAAPHVDMRTCGRVYMWTCVHLDVWTCVHVYMCTRKFFFQARYKKMLISAASNQAPACSVALSEMVIFELSELPVETRPIGVIEKLQGAVRLALSKPGRRDLLFTGRNRTV